LTTLTTKRRPGEVGLVLTTAMIYVSHSTELGKVDFLTLLQPDVSFLPVRALARLTAYRALGLALDVQHLHVAHLYLEQALHRFLDLGLGGVARDLEGNLAVQLGHDRALFRDVRAQNDSEYAFLVHASIPSSFFSAGTVTSTFS